MFRHPVQPSFLMLYIGLYSHNFNNNNNNNNNHDDIYSAVIYGASHMRTWDLSRRRQACYQCDLLTVVFLL